MGVTDGNSRQSATESPSGNTLQHGLAAIKCPAEILRSGRFSEVVAELWTEYSPQTATEQLLIDEIARRAIGIETSSAAATACQESAEKSLSKFVLSGILAAGPYAGPSAEGVPCEAADRAQRQSIAHSRAFVQAIKLLNRLQERRIQEVRPNGERPFNPFRCEVTCTGYLAAWGRRNFVCRACGNHGAHFIPSRHCLECSACKVQCGLRSGTLMADSALPLSTWFLAIWSVLREPKIKVDELQLRLGLQRVATVRAMLRKIRQALAVEQRSQLLAGLDHYDTEPESSVPLQID